MKDINEFVQATVEIKKQNNGKFGYYPFHVFAERENGECDFIVIADIESIEDCYKIMSMYVANKCKRIYMAIDFPAGGDIKTDFVAVFSSAGKHFDLFAIPYSPEDGTVYEIIPICEQLKRIVSDLRNVAFKIALEQSTSLN